MQIGVHLAQCAVVDDPKVEIMDRGAKSTHQPWRQRRSRVDLPRAQASAETPPSLFSQFHHQATATNLSSRSPRIRWVKARVNAPAFPPSDGPHPLANVHIACIDDKQIGRRLPSFQMKRQARRYGSGRAGHLDLKGPAARWHGAESEQKMAPGAPRG